jgi:hypothetical protein
VTANMNRLAPTEERKIGPKNDTTYVSPASIQHFTLIWGSKHIGRYLRFYANRPGTERLQLPRASESAVSGQFRFLITKTE